MVALMLSVYVHGRAMQCDIGCCVCMCSKAGDRCVKGVGSKKDIQRSNQRGMKVKT